LQEIDEERLWEDVREWRLLSTDPYRTETVPENYQEVVRQTYMFSNNMLQVSGTLSDEEYSSSMLESSAAYKDSWDPVRLESKPPSSVPVQTHFSCSSKWSKLCSAIWCYVTGWVVPYVLNKSSAILFPC
jgi:hypothetical protein